MWIPGKKIRLLAHHEIDKVKWDACIAAAPNGLVYAYSYYLDAMSAKWDALVMGDYDLVMPLTWNKKYGIKYIYQPFLVAQLGVFGASQEKIPVNQFISAIPRSFRFIDISLNSGNIIDLSRANTRERKNFELDLRDTYETIYSQYSENIKRNIRKSSTMGFVSKKEFDAGQVIGLAVKQMETQGVASIENVKRFRNLYEILHDKNMATTYGILLGEQLLSSCIFFFSHQRAYYILVGNHPESKNTGASHALIDAFIRDHAGQQLTLDFEGSDIPGLALFYSGFGAVNEHYTALRWNRLPWIIRWAKR